MIKLRIVGTPIPQGSTRAFSVRKKGVPTGRVVVTADNTKTKSWRQDIIDQVTGYLAARNNEGRCGLCDSLRTHCHDSSESHRIDMTFYLPRPKNHYGTGRNAANVRPSSPGRPTTKPDLDKLCRAVLDALTDAGLWCDDSQVTEITARKLYAVAGEPTGVMIEVGLYV